MGCTDNVNNYLKQNYETDVSESLQSTETLDLLYESQIYNDVVGSEDVISQNDAPRKRDSLTKTLDSYYFYKRVVSEAT